MKNDVNEKPQENQENAGDRPTKVTNLLRLSRMEVK